MKRSYLTCPHERVQQFTEYCMDCGYNIWMTKEEYLKELKREAIENDVDDTTLQIRELERRLGMQ